MLTLGNQHLYDGQLLRLAMGLHRGTHRVLEQLEKNVVKVGRGEDNLKPDFLSFRILDKKLTYKQ